MNGINKIDNQKLYYYKAILQNSNIAKVEYIKTLNSNIVYCYNSILLKSKVNIFFRKFIDKYFIKENSNLSKIKIKFSNSFKKIIVIFRNLVTLKINALKRSVYACLQGLLHKSFLNDFNNYIHTNTSSCCNVKLTIWNI